MLSVSKATCFTHQGVMSSASSGAEATSKKARKLPSPSSKKMWIESAGSPTTLRAGLPGSFSGQVGLLRVSGGSRPAAYLRPSTLV